MNTRSIISIIVALTIDVIFIRKMFMPLLKEMKAMRFLRKNGVVTTGVVTGSIKRKDNDQMNQFAMVAQFTAIDGRAYVVESTDFRYVERPVNAKVKIYYDRDNPAHAVINPASQLRFTFFLMGLIIVSLLALTGFIVMAKPK